MYNLLLFSGNEIHRILNPTFNIVSCNIWLKTILWNLKFKGKGVTKAFRSNLNESQYFMFTLLS